MTETALRAAKHSRLTRQMDALNRWMRQCARDADEAAIEANDIAYLAAHREAQVLRKAGRP